MRVGNVGHVLFLMLAMLPLLLGVEVYSSLYVGIYCGALFFLYILYLYQRDQRLFWAIAYLLFMMANIILLSIIVERGVYLIEIDRFSYPNGVTVIGLVQSVIFLVGIYAGFAFGKRLKFKFREIDIQARRLMYFLIFLVVVPALFFLLLNGLLNGFPSFIGVHRNDYWGSYAPAFGQHVIFWTIQAFFIVGWCKFVLGWRGLMFNLLLSVMIVLLLLYGNRFTGLMQAFVFYTLPYLLRVGRLDIDFKRWFKFLLLGVISVVVLAYGLSHNELGVWDSFVLRAVLQSQMWWALSELTTWYPKSMAVILDSYLGFSSDQLSKGVYYLMSMVAEPWLVSAKFETNSRFTGSGLIDSIFFFGYGIGSFVNYIWGAVYGFLCLLLVKAVLEENLPAAFLILKLSLKVILALIMGNAVEIFGLNTFVFLMLILFFISFKDRGVRV